MVAESDPAVDWAASGIVALTGRPSGPPLVPPGRAATRARELSEQISAWTADSPSPVRVDGAALLAERAAFTGARRGGQSSPGGACRLLPAADGWAAVSCARPDDPLLLSALIGAELGPDPWPPVAAWLRAHPGAELAEMAELLGLAAGPVRLGGTAVPAEPLPARSVAGLLVVDFSALWAGPLCAHLLGLAGARVVKVETPTRPDGARMGNAAFFQLLHGRHESVVLDPDTPAGRRALTALVDAADIVIESSRPRALARFGLQADEAVAAGTTWISITAAGRGSNRVGFGDDIAATSGLLASETDGAPLFCGDAIADPLTGLTAAALAMTAPADGTGVLHDIAMTEVVAATLDSEQHPTRAARRSDTGWVIDTDAGPAAVARPRRRDPVGCAPSMGEHTDTALRSLGITPP